MEKFQNSINKKKKCVCGEKMTNIRYVCSLVGLCVPNIFVESTKLQRGATPPSLMVLFFLYMSEKGGSYKVAAHIIQV